jgi:hypothetical protein
LAASASLGLILGGEHPRVVGSKPNKHNRQKMKISLKPSFLKKRAPLFEPFEAFERGFEVIVSVQNDLLFERLGVRRSYLVYLKS